MKHYGIFKRGKLSGVTRYVLSLSENGKVKHEITYYGNEGKEAAIMDGEGWIAGKIDPSKWPQDDMP